MGFLSGRAARAIVAIAGSLLLMAAGPADSPVNVPEPDGLWTGPARGYTPATLQGATVLDLDSLDALIAKEKPVLLDVSLEDHRPKGFPENRPWLPTHRSLPGSVWMPGAGAAPLDPAAEAVLLARIAALTAGDRTRAVVAFCRPECWGSWNLGKRLVQQGYTNVFWFPEGIEGWQDRHPTVATKPDPDWEARPKPVRGEGAQR
ncbi:MAG: rhodanese [Methylobacterium sp.]|jgi:PQQ-dependent catabolism-associated CXXCW motif protein|uniref:rhodanese-like domain-containing protein n=1 Tax=Methylobacterium sp. TaxID=409 RepID=UPI0025F57048|nr:rhodanese-like domain-containing protein [Methylobacterium sp.]MBX9932048.1 rhodanese [Methylobacterium sp.]